MLVLVVNRMCGSAKIVNNLVKYMGNQGQPS